MKSSVIVSACAFTLAIASPHSLEARQGVITTAICQANAATTPARPFSDFFPTADEIGTIVGPVLKALIGEKNLEEIDAIADTLCINSQQEPAGNRGICQEFLNHLNNLAVALLPQQRATSYRCLLNLICVAPSGVPTAGTCQTLLRGVDCIANRIIQAKDLECQASV
ncbi:hypothetical protein GJ744_001093 [Endocarpon pusillum]|uniref:Uncharacterized protein n=1 Tax=Endocarpon pusillum TaxID=364733 RepID=A0A8H7ADV7_9EURO|nr:hypothetical protein GJ744_001093 [Endocarpon pusillum]